MSLKNKSLMICTPCHSGSLSVEYVNSLLGFQSAAISYGVDVEVNFLHGQGAITIARNTLVTDFVESGRSHMLFIDDDIEFPALAPLELLSYEVDVVAADYPKKVLLFNQALGRSFKNSSELSRSILVGNAKGYSGTNRLVEVDYVGTGFMLISRNALDRIAADNPQIEYVENNKSMHAFFDCSISDKKYYSEDYSFCRLARSSGISIMLDRAIALSHVGRYTFGRS
jgi:hypothetical protein